MKRHALVAHLRKHGCNLVREGAKHSWFANAKRGFTPRSHATAKSSTSSCVRYAASSGYLSLDLSYSSAPSRASSRFRNSPTSVTMPVDSTEPRSASFVTTAGLMST